MSTIRSLSTRTAFATRSLKTCTTARSGKSFVEKPEDWVYSSVRNYAVGDLSILKGELLRMISLVPGMQFPFTDGKNLTLGEDAIFYACCSERHLPTL